MTNDTVRWGVLSTAKIGVQAVIPALAKARHGELAAIGSRDLARAEEVAGALGIPRAHGSYEELLADPGVDAVYIPLPNHLHTEWAMKAADAGKHVLCEKPLALSAAQAREIVEHCAAAGVKLQEAFMYRFHPQWRKAKELVDEGRIGDLRAVQTWFSYFNDDPANIRNVAEFGGGAVMDIGCYPISLSRLLFGGEPDEVRAVIHRHPRFGTDVLSSAVLRFGDGHAGFTCSTLAENGQWVHIVGTAGRIEIEIPFNSPNDRPTRIFVSGGGRSPETVSFPPVDQYTLQADAFARAILDDTEVPLPPSDAVANMAVVDAVLAAG